MRTMTVELDRFQSLVGRDNATETDTHFQIPLNLGGGATLLLTCSKTLPAIRPDCPFNPYTSIVDNRGTLAAAFGDSYQGTILNVILGAFMPATEDEPEQFEIALSGSALTPPQALVVVEWPLDNPPRDVGLDSNFAAEHGAVYYHRVDNSDPEADFSIAHGTDLWILPSESLGDFRQKIQDSWDDRDAGSEMAFRRYNMEAPHFRERFHRYDERINNILHWRLTYGDDYAELTLFPGSDDEHAHQIYYQHSGLKLLDEVVDMGLHANMLGGLLGLFSM